eukprot:COSAG02_NODE_1664_length_11434_cov_51.455404_5_plen_75_part_00
MLPMHFTPMEPSRTPVSVDVGTKCSDEDFLGKSQIMGNTQYGEMVPFSNTAVAITRVSIGLIYASVHFSEYSSW